MKKVLALLLVMIMALGAVGCGEKKEASKDKEKLVIPIISKGFQHQFWQAVNTGAKQAAEEFGVEITFDGPETESDVDKQIVMIDAALAKNPDALCLAALDSQAVVGQLQRANTAGIPIVGFDSGVESDIPVATAATNNIVAAAEAADKMAEAIGGKGEIGLVVHDQTSRTGVDRRDGFKNRIEEKYPDIKIVDIQYGEGDHLKSTEITKAMVQAYPNIKGLFGTNEGSAIGVLNGVTELGKTDIIVIGYDSGKQQQDAIREGRMYGAITQNPIGIGYEAVKAAVMAIRGETVEKEIDTGYYWYDSENIDNEEIQAVLYE